jgi:hypothetical protein
MKDLLREEKIKRNHEEIADFLASVEPANRIEREKIIGFVRWYSARDFLFCLRSGGKIVAAAAVRPVSTIEEGRTHWAFSPEGEILWIDFIAGRGRIHELYIWIAKTHFPRVRKFAGIVERENDRLRIIPLGNLARFSTLTHNRKELNNGKQ